MFTTLATNVFLVDFGFISSKLLLPNFMFQQTLHFLDSRDEKSNIIMRRRSARKTKRQKTNKQTYSNMNAALEEQT